MRLTDWPAVTALFVPLQPRTPVWPVFRFRCAVILVVLCAIAGNCMTDDQVSLLRQDTRDLFYHGYDNYMTYAFPDDELKPISCEAQTRNRYNPADIGLNDVLGNYSLTLVDSLSTLAILASSDSDSEDERNPLFDFQNGVKELVRLYGDGTEQQRCGIKACGFDLDSKVQVFETNIRGVGGLLSAHLFAVGELPIRGYHPDWKGLDHLGIPWQNGFTYNGQLLYLAYDLAQRLLPAFETATGIPYPRVNLRTGIPFYRESDTGVCRMDGTSTEGREITENCAAGAGSLILEFSALSRLTDDTRFEHLAKRAFWAIWERRSSIDLIGNGIDAESGQWTLPALSGIGAGIDSFFEYSLKSSILLSGLPYNASISIYDSPESFFGVWQQAHAAVKRHIYRSNQHEKHPYYGQVDTFTGAPRYNWIDNLSAYYPGLLVLAGELEEAVESHLLWSALWTRYGTLPERWHTANGHIDPNFKFWVGRPEFLESTFHLYQATKDHYYLHVGEMAIRDIRRLCWTSCGWADLGDVTTGEQRDRMESFFLGETAKYLNLLFTQDHPLNKLDKPVVFTTEGHPLIIPAIPRSGRRDGETKRQVRRLELHQGDREPTCPAPSPPLPLTVSNVANRGDLFHAGALAQLSLAAKQPAKASPLLESSPDSAGISFADVRSPTNYTFFPWTLPLSLIPPKGLSSPISSPVISTLTFPSFGANAVDSESGPAPVGAVLKVSDGVLINSLSNLRFNMVQQPQNLFLPDDTSIDLENFMIGQEYRIHGIANWALGRDEKVLLTDHALKGVSPNDPHFTRVKDLEMVDIVLDLPRLSEENVGTNQFEAISGNGTFNFLRGEIEAWLLGLLPNSAVHTTSSPSQTSSHPQAYAEGTPGKPALSRELIPAILPTGIGAAPLPGILDLQPLPLTSAVGRLPYSRTLYLEDVLCDYRLPASIARSFQVVFIYRGGCSFSQKLAQIPSVPPDADALQLVVIVSVPEEGIDGKDQAGSFPRSDGGLVRPLLDQPQRTPNGLERRHPISMLMVDGTPQTLAKLERVAAARGKFDGEGRFSLLDGNGVNDEHGGNANFKGGLGVKRRYWFESMGVPIANLLMV